MAAGGRVDVPSEHSTTVDLAWQSTANQSASHSSWGRRSLRAPRDPALRASSRTGISQVDSGVSGGWPLAGLVCCTGDPTGDQGQAVLRSTPKALEVVFGFLRGRVVTTTMMAWTTVRCWLMRLGLYALLRPLEQADDWAYLIDHTVQIGTVKCFAVVGVRLSQLPYPRSCLQREDLVLIALVPMQQSNAMTVNKP